MSSVCSAELVIRNNKSGRAQDNREKCAEKRRVSAEAERCAAAGEAAGKVSEVNNNSICTDPSQGPQPKECNLGELDSIIQNQYDILSMAVKNILAVSSEDIYGKNKSDGRNKKVKYLSTDNIPGKENEFLSIVEDLEFKEALCRFSEESLSMSAENILTTSLKNLSFGSRKKLIHKSLNVFPIISEGKMCMYMNLTLHYTLHCTAQGIFYISGNNSVNCQLHQYFGHHLLRKESVF